MKDEKRGPAAGFDYQRRLNRKGEEAGGIAPHVTLKSVANNESPEGEVLVDRPEKDDRITRVSGAFCVEATIPTPVSLNDDAVAAVDDSRRVKRSMIAGPVMRFLTADRKTALIERRYNELVVVEELA